jgi:hypothetical protein
MHARANKYVADGKDPREMKVDGVRQMEYDGLRGGELAWVLGRRFKHAGTDSGAAQDAAKDASGAFDPAALEVGGASRYAHMAYAGLGSGVDRMQRLASTGWMEEMVKQHLGSKEIALHQLVLNTQYQRATDGLMADYGVYVTGGTAMYCPDPVHTFLTTAGQAVSAGPARISGVNVFETGPFLRGMQVNTNDVSLKFDATGKPMLKDFNERVKTGSLPRNLGDMCVLSAIESEIRRRNFMDWSPDGVVLSKLESPTDQPLSSSEIDAQQAQLFNLAVQGPAITTAWTSDIRDHKLECQPMDKVFICLVADLAWKEATGGDAATLQNAMNGVHAQLYNDGDLPAAIGQALQGARDYVGLAAPVANPEPEFITACRDMRDKGKSPDEKAAAAAKMDRLLDMEKAEVPLFKTRAREFRAGTRRVGKAYLTNFRLMRSTSSHMTNYSKFVSGKKNSRCGLGYNYPEMPPAATGTPCQGAGSYIVGAWCVGTVLDSAASRSTVGTLVRTAPTSMALNINVNVCWWSSDKLYKEYMDRSLVQRGQAYPVEEAAGPNKGKRKFALADLDRAKAGTLAAAAVVPFASAVDEDVDVGDVEVPGEGGSAFAESAREAAGASSSSRVGKRR